MEREPWPGCTPPREATAVSCSARGTPCSIGIEDACDGALVHRVSLQGAWGLTPHALDSLTRTPKSTRRTPRGVHIDMDAEAPSQRLPSLNARGVVNQPVSRRGHTPYDTRPLRIRNCSPYDACRQGTWFIK